MAVSKKFGKLNENSDHLPFFDNLGSVHIYEKISHLTLRVYFTRQNYPKQARRGDSHKLSRFMRPGGKYEVDEVDIRGQLA